MGETVAIDTFRSKEEREGAGWFVGYFRLFTVATGCPSERRPWKTVSCYGG